MRAEGPPVRRTVFGWPAAIGAAGLGVAVLLVGIWVFRIPIAEMAVRDMLARKGVESDFRIQRLDFTGAAFSSFRIGAETSPDAAASAVNVRFGWRGLSPEVRSVQILEPRLRLRLDPAGRVSAGSLEQLAGEDGGGGRPSIPRIGLDIQDGQALVEAPFGALTFTFHASGTPGRDFSANARMAPTTRPGEDYALDGGVAELVAASTDDTLSIAVTAAAAGGRWDGVAFTQTSLNAAARAPLDLATARAQLSWSFGALESAAFSARGWTGQASGEAKLLEQRIAPEEWRASLQSTAESLAAGDTRLDGARLATEWRGGADSGGGEWTLTGARFAGGGLISDAPQASGEAAFEMRGDENFTALTQVRLARTRLSDAAQEDMRGAIPNLSGAPIGPTFASLERALDIGADQFDLTAPLTVQWSETGWRFVVGEPITAAARSGARVTLAPLREDSPALVMQWPGGEQNPRMFGAIALELAGGGLPDGDLLLDSLDWSPGAPFEADGTLSLANWRAEGASFDARELRVALLLAPDGGGRLELDGAARITGPLADGQVRDLTPELDVAVAWKDGWRVSPRDGCLPVGVGGLDVAGLSFQRGAMRLCAGPGGALIAADANQNLSGGFLIQNLALNGRMAGENGQPARLQSSAVRGQFGGRMGDIRLDVEASAPALDIDMAEDRTLAVAGERLTANVQVTDAGWRVDGAFAAGTLADPTLPGAVSAIGGSWSAAPENNETVIRVAAGEARIVARVDPQSADQRPLFNPLRVANAEAEMRAGRIVADGDIILEDGARGVARFTAVHDIGEGAGRADIVADALVFNQNLQPFELSELARGVIENVRGHVGVEAQVVWRADNVTASAVVRPDDVALSTATIPLIEGVSGEVVFDDLFALTTPPGQVLHVRALNPGVEVRDGQIQFQLLPESQVAIERAEFAFASGVLAMAPTIITLGAEETRFELTLRDVDVAALIAQLNVPDLTATGRVEGSFPLVLNRRTALIEGGVLRASPEGGTIAYTGNAGAGVTGPAAMAFQALSSFRYDRLSLTLDGDLSGDLVTRIDFSGENTDRTVELIDETGIPGVGGVRVSGVPFRFNVQLTAPFRRLADTALSITDATSVVDQAIRPQEEETPEEVDPPPNTPR